MLENCKIALIWISREWHLRSLKLKTKNISMQTPKPGENLLRIHFWPLQSVFSAFVASANMLLRGRIWKLAQTLQSLFAIYTPIFSAVIGIPQNLFTLAPRALNPNVNVFNQHNTHYES